MVYIITCDTSWRVASGPPTSIGQYPAAPLQLVNLSLISCCFSGVQAAKLRAHRSPADGGGGAAASEIYGIRFGEIYNHIFSQ